MFDADGRPVHVTWNYTRGEMIADGIGHGLGIALALAGAATLIALALLAADPRIVPAVTIYAVCLLALLCTSAAYNLWPISRTKWLLRRFDHAAIFFLIAATYTPFVARFPDGFATTALLVGVWAIALFGAALKILLPGRFDRISIVLCVALGASGALVWDTVAAALDPTTVGLIVAGGAIYVAGVAFHLWESLRFQNAVWHGFVLVASAVFYSAILSGVVLA